MIRPTIIVKPLNWRFIIKCKGIYSSCLQRFACYTCLSLIGFIFISIKYSFQVHYSNVTCWLQVHYTIFVWSFVVFDSILSHFTLISLLFDRSYKVMESHYYKILRLLVVVFLCDWLWFALFPIKCWWVMLFIFPK